MGFPGNSNGKQSACDVRDLGSRRSPAEGHGSPLQYSRLENPMDRGAWQAIIHGVIESNITERLTLLNIYTHTHIYIYILSSSASLELSYLN